MSKKTVKDLDSELTQVKDQFKDLEAKFHLLYEKHEVLEKKYEEVTTKKEFKCDGCDKHFTSVGKLRRHERTHKSTSRAFQCEKCEIVCNEEWKLKAHSKMHAKYSCEICDKTFKNEETKSKHKRIVHENLKLYCHYFNNGKDCPYQEEFIFLHEASKSCKYGGVCERQLCMFRHGVNDDVIEDIDDDEDNDKTNQTFSNPSQENRPIETVELRVNVPCRDLYLKNDQTFYRRELEKFNEIEKIEHLYVHSSSGYSVGTYLDTYIKFKTKYAENFKNNKQFRESVWDRLNIKETCSE